GQETRRYAFYHIGVDQCTRIQISCESRPQLGFQASTTMGRATTVEGRIRAVASGDALINPPSPGFYQLPGGPGSTTGHNLSSIESTTGGGRLKPYAGDLFFTSGFDNTGGILYLSRLQL
ncbi:unnamed protein product, partial [Phaeothamnion confervicola]